MSTTTSRGQIHADYRVNERDVLARLIASCDLSPETRATISRRGAALVQDIRDGSDPTIMELFLGEYGLSSDEGVALMCLAEALLRVPDTATIDDLIEDKIAPSQWSAHLGQSHSPLINASTWALMLTGRVLDDAGDGLVAGVRGLIKRVGEPLIRTAVSHAMREMGRQFVLGETISTAMERAAGMGTPIAINWPMRGRLPRSRRGPPRTILPRTPEFRSSFPRSTPAMNRCSARRFAKSWRRVCCPS